MKILVLFVLFCFALSNKAIDSNQHLFFVSLQICSRVSLRFKPGSEIYVSHTNNNECMLIIIRKSQIPL